MSQETTDLSKDIQTLQKLRATLEIVREATNNINQDILTATDNQKSVSAELSRTAAAIDKL